MKRLGIILATVIVGLVGGLCAGRWLAAQPAGLTQTMLMRAHLAGIEGREAVMGLAEIAPGAAAGRHVHASVELGYVLAGTAILEVEGDEAVMLQAGDAYVIDAGRVHEAKAVGASPAKVLAVWIVEKGQPLATPVP